MSLDHSGATAIVSFEGLMLFHTDSGAPCEINVLSCERHKLDLTIHEIRLDDTRTPTSERIIRHDLDLKEDIYITVRNPLAPGVVPHKPGGPLVFNRRDDTGDAEDIRWILDLQNAELNNGPVRLTQGLTAANAKEFKSRILIDNCTLYTEMKTNERFAREHVGSQPLALDFLGKAAFRVAADLSCEPETEIVLSNEPNPQPDSQSSVVLIQNNNKQYKIEIENECDIGDSELHGSDFRFYYDALTTPGGKVFDLRRVVENVSGRSPDDPLTGPANFSSDDFPRTCLVGGRGVGP